MTATGIKRWHMPGPLLQYLGASENIGTPSKRPATLEGQCQRGGSPCHLLVSR